MSEAIDIKCELLQFVLVDGVNCFWLVWVTSEKVAQTVVLFQKLCVANRVLKLVERIRGSRFVIFKLTIHLRDCAPSRAFLYLLALYEACELLI